MKSDIDLLNMISNFIIIQTTDIVDVNNSKIDSLSNNIKTLKLDKSNQNTDSNHETETLINQVIELYYYMMPHIVKEYNYSDNSSEIKIIKPRGNTKEIDRFNNDLTLIISNTKLLQDDNLVEITPHEYILNAFYVFDKESPSKYHLINTVFERKQAQILPTFFDQDQILQLSKLIKNIKYQDVMTLNTKISGQILYNYCTISNQFLSNSSIPQRNVYQKYFLNRDQKNILKKFSKQLIESTESMLLNNKQNYQELYDEIQDLFQNLIHQKIKEYEYIQKCEQQQNKLCSDLRIILKKILQKITRHNSKNKNSDIISLTESVKKQCQIYLSNITNKFQDDDQSQYDKEFESLCTDNIIYNISQKQHEQIKSNLNQNNDYSMEVMCLEILKGSVEIFDKFKLFNQIVVKKLNDQKEYQGLTKNKLKIENLELQNSFIQKIKTLESKLKSEKDKEKETMSRQKLQFGNIKEITENQETLKKSYDELKNHHDMNNSSLNQKIKELEQQIQEDEESFDGKLKKINEQQLSQNFCGIIQPKPYQKCN